MGSLIVPIWCLTEKQEVSPTVPCGGWAGVRKRGLSVLVLVCCAAGFLCHCLMPSDRGDLCLVRGCAKEDFSLVLSGGRSSGNGKRTAKI